jgi:hypothetical protein
MNSLSLYIFILVAPAVIFSLRIIFIEISNLLSVSDYASKLQWLNSFIRNLMMGLRYISQRSFGVIPNLIKQSFAKYESGRNLAQTMDFIAVATSSHQVRRLTNSIQIAIERGTPVLDVLNNQVQALNKQINIALLKKSGKSEIALLIPVVFLILPVSISFAIWPSIYGLNQAGF